TNRRPPIYVGSITLPRSPVSLSSGDEVPRIFTRKSRLQPGEFLITSAKRLLQHNRHKADLVAPSTFVRFWGKADIRCAPALTVSDGIDPKRTRGVAFCCDARH